MVLVAHSEYVAILPRAAVQVMKDQIELTTVPPPFPFSDFAYDLVWHNRLHGIPPNSGFVKCCCDAPNRLRPPDSAEVRAVILSDPTSSVEKSAQIE